MRVHVIKDIYRPFENTTLAKELKDIDHQVWDAVHDPIDVVSSIGRSHKQIVQYAKDQGLDEICIMEEDVWFPAEDGWQYFLAGKPASFDLYLGGVYGLNQGARERMEGKSGALPINNFAGLHCYIIHSRYYEKFLSLPENKHIDDQPGLGEFYVCFPFAALQHPGWSANNKQMVDYNTPRQIPPDYVYR